MNFLLNKKRIFKIKKTFFLIFFFSTFFLISQNVFSQGLEYRMVSYGPGEAGRATTPLFNMEIFNREVFTINYSGFSKSFQFIFDLIIGISIATAVIVFMIAAFQKIINDNNVKQIKEGEKGMVNALVGLMIVLSTWLIINTINPDLIRLPMFNGLDNIKPVDKGGPEQNVSGGSF